MNYRLINKPNEKFSPVEQVCFNRGVYNLEEYTNINRSYINTPFDFPLNLLNKGKEAIGKAFKNNEKILLVVDSDCDGFCSAALLYNYFYKLMPNYIHLFSWVLHSGKQHGLSEWSDIIDRYSLIICPDAGTNDNDIFEAFPQKTFLIIDHHLKETEKEYGNAIIINNQTCDYPNKELSGTGVVWQFCRFIDAQCSTFYADNFLDLVALSCVSDMMSLHSLETKTLVNIGFEFGNIKNTFIEYMLDKNEYSLNKADYVSYTGKACTPMGAAFFIAPFVNAMVRSGEQDEKELLFLSMLEPFAKEEILSNKQRNRKPGEKEERVIQAIRTVINVKNRQTRAEKAGMEFLENKIKENDCLSNKALIFFLNENDMPSTIRGLAANKLMGKYNRPCCVLSKTSNGTYEGSARGYTKTGIEDFKSYCASYPYILYTAGHANAFGLGIPEDKADDFLNYINKQLENFSSEIIYYIDYNLTNEENPYYIVKEIGKMNDYWGQDFERSHVAIKFKITSSNMRVYKGNTLNIYLPNDITIVKFGATDDEIKLFSTQGYVEVDSVCKCSLNTYNGETSPQLILEDYDIIRKSDFYF